MMDDLQKAYTAYQQALYHLPNPKEPKLWYGIGILYDRYGSLEHAEEAFASVVRMDPNYEKANEIYFRLGIIYKQQNKFGASLECFRYILSNPPRPLTEVDIWFQIGHVYEQQKDFALAKEAYERVLAENPSHAKVLQQLGWLYHQSNAGFQNQERAIQFLTKSLESDPNDSQSWYLLGRAYMAGQNYNKAYEAYQQAVYRDGKNPTFWCSIGVLYYQINQFRDALDAYSRAIRLNPYISEVWFDLGSLYESCNNQISDAIDAYARAAELDPENQHIQQRLMLLRNAEAKGEQVSSAPTPQDVHPTAYANASGIAPGPPSQIGGAPPPGQYAHGGPGGPLLPPGGGPPPPGEGMGGARDLPGPGGRHSPGIDRDMPQRGGPPPAIPNIDDRGIRGPSQTPFAPMDAPPIGSSARTSPSMSRSYAAPPPPHPRDSPRNQPAHAYPSDPRHVDQYGRPLPPSHMDREREHDMREREREWQRGGSHQAVPRGGEPPVSRYGNGRNSPPGSYDHGPAYGGPGGPAEAVGGGAPYDPLDRSRPLRRSDGSTGDKEQNDVPTGSGMPPSGPASAIKGVKKASRKPKATADGASPVPRNKKAAESPRGQSPPPSRGSKGSASKPGTAPHTPRHVPEEVPSAGPAPSRKVDEDYDEGAADALLGLASAASASAAMPPRPAPAAQPSPPVDSANGVQTSEPVMTDKEAPSPPASSVLGKRSADETNGSDGPNGKPQSPTSHTASRDEAAAVTGGAPASPEAGPSQSKKPRHEESATTADEVAPSTGASAEVAEPVAAAEASAASEVQEATQETKAPAAVPATAGAPEAAADKPAKTAPAPAEEAASAAEAETVEEAAAAAEPVAATPAEPVNNSSKEEGEVEEEAEEGEVKAAVGAAGDSEAKEKEDNKEKEKVDEEKMDEGK